MFVERRSVPRYKTAERATAILNPQSRVSCIIVDLSTKGARLGFGAEVSLPQLFEIEFAKTGERIDVHRVWQRGLVAGVQFQPTIAERLDVLSWFRRVWQAGHCHAKADRHPNRR